MKIKFSGLGVVDGRGKINGTVASKGRSGAVARVKVSGVNRQTTYQLTARARLTFFSQQWRALGAAVIDAWNSASSQFTGTNVFGDGVSPTGKNLYTRLNANLASVGQPPLTNPPTPQGTEQPFVSSITVTGSGVREIHYTGTTASSELQVWATAPQSPGVRYLRNKFRLIGTANGDTSSPLDFGPQYLAKFGNPPFGTLVGVELVAIRNGTGEASKSCRGTALVN